MHQDKFMSMHFRACHTLLTSHVDLALGAGMSAAALVFRHPPEHMRVIGDHHPTNIYKYEIWLKKIKINATSPTFG